MNINLILQFLACTTITAGVSVGGYFAYRHIYIDGPANKQKTLDEQLLAIKAKITEQQTFLDGNDALLEKLNKEITELTQQKTAWGEQTSATSWTPLKAAIDEFALAIKEPIPTWEATITPEMVDSLLAKYTAKWNKAIAEEATAFNSWKSSEINLKAEEAKVEGFKKELEEDEKEEAAAIKAYNEQKAIEDELVALKTTESSTQSAYEAQEKQQATDQQALDTANQAKTNAENAVKALTEPVASEEITAKLAALKLLEEAETKDEDAIKTAKEDTALVAHLKAVEDYKTQKLDLEVKVAEAEETIKTSTATIEASKAKTKELKEASDAAKKAVTDKQAIVSAFETKTSDLLVAKVKATSKKTTKSSIVVGAEGNIAAIKATLKHFKESWTINLDEAEKKQEPIAALKTAWSDKWTLETKLKDLQQEVANNPTKVATVKEEIEKNKKIKEKLELEISKIKEEVK